MIFFYLSRRAALAACTLALVTSCGGGGGSRGGAIVILPDPVESSFTASTTFGSLADGLEAVEIETVLADGAGTPMPGLQVDLRATGPGTLVAQPALSDETGFAAGRVRATVPGVKSISAFVTVEGVEVEVGRVAVTFVEPRDATYYVRANGSDARSGIGPTQAWRTLEHALTRVGAGDTLYVGAGTYAPISITKAASPEAPLMIVGDRTGRYTGDAGDVLIDATGMPAAVHFSSAFDVTLRGFTLVGADAGIDFAPTLNERVHLVENVSYDNGIGVRVRSGRAILLEGNTISGNTGDGIVFGLTANCLVANNLVYANGGAGIGLDDVSTDLTVTLNTFFRNEGDHFAERSIGSTGEISNNVLTEGGGDAIGIDSESGMNPSFNLSWANSGSGTQRSAPDPNSIIADPQLTNPFGEDGVLGGYGYADDDFRVASSSAALEAGDRDARDLLLMYGGASRTRSSRVDELLDGQTPDDPTVNLGFHYPVALPDFVGLGSSATGRAMFARANEAMLRRSDRGADGIWSPTGRSAYTNAGARWVVRASSPNGYGEITAALAASGNDAQLYVHRWNGRLLESEPPIRGAIAATDANERGFDVVYESQSGDALLVYSKGDSNPLFRTLERGRWSAPSEVFETVLGAGKVLWVELVADPNSDRVALVALDGALHLVAAVWDGDAWTLPILLDTQIVSVREFRPFDAAFESQSGDLLVIWGYSVFAEAARFATLDAGDTAWARGVHTSTEAIGATITLASDPTSDRIVAGFGEGDLDDDVTVSVWNGSAFENTAELSLFGAAKQQSIQVGWLGDSGIAFAMWRNAGQTAGFQRARFVKTWHVEAPVVPNGVGTVLRAEARAVPGTDAAEVLVLDDDGELYSLRATFGGVTTSWSSARIASGLDATGRTVPFDFDLR